MQLLGPLVPLPKQEKSTSHYTQRANSQGVEQDAGETIGQRPDSVKGVLKRQSLVDKLHRLTIHPENKLIRLLHVKTQGLIYGKTLGLCN